MIVTAAGKRIAFGVQWKPQLGASSYQKQVQRECKQIKPTLIWTDPHDHLLGAYLSEIQGSASGVHAAGQVLKNVIASGRFGDDIQNALWIIQCDDGTHLTTALIDGKPRLTYDDFELTSEEIGELTERFAELAARSGANTLIVGDAPLHEIRPLTLDEAAEYATAASLMRVPRYSSDGLKAGLIVGTVVIMAAAGHFGYQKYRAMKLAQAQANKLSDAQLYERSILQLGNDRVARVADLANWYDWFLSLPLRVGGWQVSRIECNFAQVQANCNVTLSAKALEGQGNIILATNRTYTAAAPSNWPKPTYDQDGRSISVSFNVPLGAGHLMRESLASAPDETGFANGFRADLQELSRFSSKAGMTDKAQVFGATGVNEKGLVRPYYVWNWSIEGPIRLYEVVKEFPAYVVVSSAVIDIQDKPKENVKDSAQKLTLNGSAFLRGK